MRTRKEQPITIRLAPYLKAKVAFKWRDNLCGQDALSVLLAAAFPAIDFKSCGPWGKAIEHLRDLLLPTSRGGAKRIEELQQIIEDSCAAGYPQYGGERWQKGDETCMYDLLCSLTSESKEAQQLFCTIIETTQKCLVHGVEHSLTKIRSVMAVEISSVAAGSVAEVGESGFATFSLQRVLEHILSEREGKKCGQCDRAMVKGDAIITLPLILAIILLHVPGEEYFTVVLPNMVSMRGYMVLQDNIHIGGASFSLRAIHLATSRHHTCYFSVGSHWHYYDDMEAGAIETIGPVLDIKDVSLISSMFYERNM